MRVALIGRGRSLLETGRRLLDSGHEIPLVWTCRSEAYYGIDEQDFRAFADSIGAEFHDDVNINTPENVARIAGLDCDLAVSLNWLSLLRQPLIRTFPLGILNSHAGDLPRFRGNACPNWAILAGEPHVGLCAHLMVPDLDAGPVVLRDRFPLGPETYIGDVYAWLERRTPEMLLEAAEGLAEGRLVPVPQSDDPSQGLRTYPRRPEDGRIDWRWPAETVARLVRASSRPFEGAYAFLEGERKVVVWRASVLVDPVPFLAVPGQVCFKIDGDPVVACGSGLIRLTEVDLDGGTSQEQAKLIIGKSLRNRLS